MSRNSKTMPRSVGPDQRAAEQRRHQGETHVSELGEVHDAGAPNRAYRIILVEEGHVAERGTSSTLWFVRTRQGWQRPGAIREAVGSEMTPAARTVWSRRWELVLPQGTRLMRHDTRPTDYERREPIDILLDRRAARRRVVRTYYRIGSSGELTRETGRS